jgi:hypothetical protein
MVKQETLSRSFYFTLTILFGILTFTILQGSLQNYIHFAGFKNEIGSCLCTAMLTIGFFIQTVSSSKK